EVSCDIVGTASHGRAVLETARRLNPDVIVLDVNLGETNGLDLCSEITRELPSIQVVLVSATVPAELQDAAHHAVASSFVSKFVGISELESAIRCAYGAARSQPMFAVGGTGLALRPCRSSASISRTGFDGDDAVAVGGAPSLSTVFRWRLRNGGGMRA